MNKQQILDEKQRILEADPNDLLYCPECEIALGFLTEGKEKIKTSEHHLTRCSLAYWNGELRNNS